MNEYKLDNKIYEKFLKVSLEDESLEFECVFDEKEISKTTFMRLLDKLKEKNEFVGDVTSLDIKCVQNRKFSPIRISILGLEEIKKYCKTDKLNELEDPIFLKKDLYKDMAGGFTTKGGPIGYVFKEGKKDFSYRLNIKTEIPLKKENPEVTELLTNYSNKPKHFRFKKRYSYITQDKLFRFDLTAIKTSPDLKNGRLFKTFKQSNIMKNTEIFEFEIEYIGAQLYENEKTIDKFYEKLLNSEIVSPYDFNIKKV